MQVGAAVGSIALVTLLCFVFLLAFRRYLRREPVPASPSSGAGKFNSPPQSNYSISQSFSPPTFQVSESDYNQESRNPFVYTHQ